MDAKRPDAGLTLTLGRDTLGRIDDLNWKMGQTPVDQFHYAFDRNSNIVSRRSSLSSSASES